jgi:hypothetical protein
MRYRVFMMLVANSVAAQAAPAPHPSPASDMRRAREMQTEPKRWIIEPRLLPYVADVAVLRAAVLPPSERIAIHLALYGERDPRNPDEQMLHIRTGTFWPVARIRTATGSTQVSVMADRRARVRTEYRTEVHGADQIVAGQHVVSLDRRVVTPRGVELQGRAWQVNGGVRAFSALVERQDLACTFNLGKIGSSTLRLDVQGDKLTGLSVVAAG